MKRKKPRIFLLAIAFGMAAAHATAQHLALKNNLLYDASLTPNVSAEVLLSRKWTLDTTFGLNPWTFSDNRKWRHWMLQPELRRWMCQSFNGSFWGFHALGGEFNAGHVDFPLGIAPCLHNNRYEGWFLGGGVIYGHQWPITRHFSLEAAFGLGYAHLWHRKYPCTHCGTETGRGHYNYLGPTKAAINIIYNL